MREEPAEHSRPLDANDQELGTEDRRLILIEMRERLEEREDDLADIALDTVRMLTDSGERISLDEVLEMFGYTREELTESG
jgi:hypothetical protein